MLLHTPFFRFLFACFHPVKLGRTICFISALVLPMLGFASYTPPQITSDELNFGLNTNDSASIASTTSYAAIGNPDAGIGEVAVYDLNNIDPGTGPTLVQVIDNDDLVAVNQSLPPDAKFGQAIAMIDSKLVIGTATDRVFFFDFDAANERYVIVPELTYQFIERKTVALKFLSSDLLLVHIACFGTPYCPVDVLNDGFSVLSISATDVKSVGEISGNRLGANGGISQLTRIDGDGERVMVTGLMFTPPFLETALVYDIKVGSMFIEYKGSLTVPLSGEPVLPLEDAAGFGNLDRVIDVAVSGNQSAVLMQRSDFSQPGGLEYAIILLIESDSNGDLQLVDRFELGDESGIEPVEFEFDRVTSIAFSGDDLVVNVTFIKPDPMGDISRSSGVLLSRDFRGDNQWGQRAQLIGFEAPDGPASLPFDISVNDDQIIAAGGQAIIYSRQDIDMTDADVDGVPDSYDNCLVVANELQQDSDGDNYGNACDADLNNDCMINMSDLTLLKQDFFATGDDLVADLNEDGVVNFSDLANIRAEFYGQPQDSALTSSCE